MPKGHYPRHVTTDDEYRARFKGYYAEGWSDACWPWRGRCSPNGYGRFSMHGRDRGAHVVALVFAGVAVPRGAVVMHSCDNPPCVNPRHLKVATQRENRLDAARKGRTARGERNGVPRRLTASTVRTIRRSAKPQAVLAALYGISQPLVSEIKARKKYTWVT